MLKHIKGFICDSLDFLIKYPRDIGEYTEIVIFDVINVYKSMPQEFALKPLLSFDNISKGVISKILKGIWFTVSEFYT